MEKEFENHDLSKKTCRILEGPVMKRLKVKTFEAMQSLESQLATRRA